MLFQANDLHDTKLTLHFKNCLFYLKNLRVALHGDIETPTYPLPPQGWKLNLQLPKRQVEHFPEAKCQCSTAPFSLYFALFSGHFVLNSVSRHCFQCSEHWIQWQWQFELWNQYSQFFRVKSNLTEVNLIPRFFENSIFYVYLRKQLIKECHISRSTSKHPYEGKQKYARKEHVKLAKRICEKREPRVVLIGGNKHLRISLHPNFPQFHIETLREGISRATVKLALYN